MKYIRIGTDYFKFCQLPLFSGDKKTVLIKWAKGEIITDHGKDFLESIEKFDGFVNFPSHTDYQQIIGNFYNRYEKIEFELKNGEFPKTKAFLEHVFGEQYDLGIDYLSILWQKPLQILPILCLVSKQRNTGKTTFLNWLKCIFQNNMTLNKNEDFRSPFNSDWANCLIIGVDEVLLNKIEDAEKIKNMSTAQVYKTESKGKDKVESVFYGKIILCSNNEDDFIKIDENEIRYWVRKIPTLRSSDPDLLEGLRKEIPYFLNFINNRKIVTPKQSRMWFTKEQIYTDALAQLIHGSKSNLSKELTELLIDDFLKFEVEELKYSLGDLLDKLRDSNIRVIKSALAKTLKEVFKKDSINGVYKKYYLAEMPGNAYSTSSLNSRGRHFTFFRKDFLDKTTQE